MHALCIPKKRTQVHVTNLGIYLHSENTDLHGGAV